MRAWFSRFAVRQDFCEMSFLILGSWNSPWEQSLMFTSAWSPGYHRHPSHLPGHEHTDNKPSLHRDCSSSLLLVSLSSSIKQQEIILFDTFWKYWHQYVQIFKGKWVAHIWREKQSAPFNLFMRGKHISFCLKRHQTVALSLKHSDFADEAQFWAQTQHQADTCALLFTTHPSNQCLPAFFVCFRVHDLALLLNDAYQWWPS